MTGMYNEKNIAMGVEGGASSALRRGLYELCGSAIFAVLLILAGWGGAIVLDRLMTFVGF